MNDEMMIVVGGYLFYLATIILALLKSKRKRLEIGVQMLIVVLSHLFVKLNLEYNSSGGGSLAYMFLHVVYMGVHSFVNILLFFVRLFQK